MNHLSLPLLQAKQIKKSFIKNKKEIPVVRGVDLNIMSGELLAITGASGVGKSTLLHILGTLDHPSSGEVLFGSEAQNLFLLSERGLSEFRNRALGFVFQFHYLLLEFSALENVMMPALIAGHKKAWAQAEAARWLELVGLEQRMHHRPSELSGGEQQRVAIARALILKPRLLLADELTGNLDSKNRKNVMDLLIRLNQETGVAILLVTHDLELAQKMDRVLVMADGVWAN